VNNFRYRRFRSIDCKISFNWNFIRTIYQNSRIEHQFPLLRISSDEYRGERLTNSSESSNLSIPRLLVNSPPVRLLAMIEWRRYMNQEEVSSSSSSILNNVLLSLLTRSFVRRYGRGENGSSCSSKFGGDEGDS
jgi:hypothetical protein